MHASLLGANAGFSSPHTNKAATKEQTKRLDYGQLLENFDCKS